MFEEFLIIPVGQVFGSRSAPSYYCLVADIREALTSARAIESHSTFDDLVFNCSFEVQRSTPLAGVPPDSHYPPLSSVELQRRFYNASYVDDQAVLAYTYDMPAALNSSIKAADEVFGKGDRLGQCLQAKKWVLEVSEQFMFLGFLIDSHAMTVSWPLFKRQHLYTALQTILKQKRKYVTPKEISHISHWSGPVRIQCFPVGHLLKL